MAITVACILCAGLAQAGVRIAVIAGDEDRGAADVLTSELSRLDSVVVLERAEIEKVLREQAIVLSGITGGDFKAGQLLGADGLIILSRVTPGENPALVARLVAMEPGVVLDLCYSTLPLENMQTWAGRLAARCSLLLPKLHVAKHDAVAISILNIRAPVGSPQGRQLEEQLGALLGHRLTRERNLFVLERQRLAALAWEKALRPDADSPFWTGSYLVDGKLGGDGTNVTLQLRVRGRDRQEIRVEAAGRRARLPELVEDATAKLTHALKRQPDALPWDRSAEADEFFREAQWAYHTQLYRHAIMAAESAWALGRQDDDVLRLRIYAYGDSLFPYRSSTLYVSEPINARTPDALDSAIPALELILEYLGLHPPGDRDGKGQGELARMAGLLGSAGRVLSLYYKAGTMSEYPEHTRRLRELMRSVYSGLAASPDPDVASETGKAAARYAGFWQETVRDAIAFYRTFLTANLQEDDVAIGQRRERVREFLTAAPPSSESWLPLAVDGETGRDQTEAFRANVLAGQGKVGNSADRVWVALVKTRTGQGADLEETRVLLQEIAADLIGGRKAGDAYAVLMKTVPDSEVRERKAFYLDLAHSLFAENAHPAGFGSFLASELIKALEYGLSQEEAAALYAAIRQRQARGDVTDNHQISGMLAAHLPEVNSAATNGFRVTRSWKPPRGGDVLLARYVSNELWCAIQENGSILRVLRLDPDRFSTVEDFELHIDSTPQKGARCPTDACPWLLEDLVADRDAVFLLARCCVMRWDRMTRRLQRLDVPHSTYTAMARQGGGLYLGYRTDEGSGVFRHDLGTGQTSVLASSRRKPGEGPLDDSAPYWVKTLVPDGSRSVLVHVYKEKELEIVYAFSPDNNEWDERFRFNRNSSAVPCPGGVLLCSEALEFLFLNLQDGATEYLMHGPWYQPDKSKPWRWVCGRNVEPEPVNWKSCNAFYNGGVLYVLCRRSQVNHWTHGIACFGKDLPASGVVVPLGVDSNEVPDHPNLLFAGSGFILWRPRTPTLWYLPVEDVLNWVGEDRQGSQQEIRL